LREGTAQLKRVDVLPDPRRQPIDIVELAGFERGDEPVDALVDGADLDGRGRVDWITGGGVLLAERPDLISGVVLSVRTCSRQEPRPRQELERCVQHE
jgi:hypothetical protein